jgi:Sec-independent protein translocase protein TatA
MEILGIGPLEILFILLIALIILGPGDMVKAGLTLGRFLRKIITSPEWRTIQKASRELRYLPNRLMREASLEDLSKDLPEINKIGGQLNNELKKMELDLSSWTTPPDSLNLKLDQIPKDEEELKTEESPDIPDNPNDSK